MVINSEKQLGLILSDRKKLEGLCQTLCNFESKIELDLAVNENLKVEKQYYLISQCALEISNNIKLPENVCLNFLSGKIASEVGVLCINKELAFIFKLKTDNEVYLDILFKDLKDGSPRLQHYKIILSESFENNVARIFKEIYEDGVPLEDNPTNLKESIIMFLRLLLFMYCSEHEIQLVHARQSVKSAEGEKIMNSTNSEILIINVNKDWNIIKISDAFNVRGHFRLQGYGKDRQESYEIIYIAPFIKDGYTSTGKGVKNKTLKIKC